MYTQAGRGNKSSVASLDRPRSVSRCNVCAVHYIIYYMKGARAREMAYCSRCKYIQQKCGQEGLAATTTTTTTIISTREYVYKDVPAYIYSKANPLRFALITLDAARSESARERERCSFCDPFGIMYIYIYITRSCCSGQSRGLCSVPLLLLLLQHTRRRTPRRSSNLARELMSIVR